MKTTLKAPMRTLALVSLLVTAGLAASFAWPHTGSGGPAQVAATDGEEPVASPAVIAVKFHADWCGSCRAMGPIFTDLRNKFDTAPVLFLELDHTNEPSRRQAEYLAAALGLQEVWKADGGSTGFILLIDASTRAVLARLTKEHDLKAMGSQLFEAVEHASGTKR